MKKLIAFVTMLCIAFSLFAGFEYRLDALSFSPIHDIYLADKASASLQMNYMNIYKGFPDHVYQDTSNPMYWELVGGIRGKPYVMEFKAGEQLSFLRNTFTFDHPIFTHVSIDPLTVQGIINEVLEGGISDMIGYEGVYFYGSAINIADIVSMRVGVHHYCSHYGDATYKRIPDVTGFDRNYKYIRMNGMAIGLSITPYPGIRLYGEYNFIPHNYQNTRPNIFATADSEHYDKIAPKEYGNRIISFGLELSYPIFKKMGKTTLAYDCHMYEEGKIIYKDRTKTGADQYLKFPRTDAELADHEHYIHYDADAPWYMEHGLVLNQELTSYMSFEIGWHYGRLPLSYMFWCDESQWAYIGFRFDCDATVPIYDTAKH